MMKLNIQLFADGKIVIDTQLNSKNFENRDFISPILLC